MSVTDLAVKEPKNVWLQLSQPLKYKGIYEILKINKNACL